MTSVIHYRDPIAYRNGDLMGTNYVPPHMASLNRSPVYDDHSSGSERKHSSAGAKKRPSRAGTRSVTTLTAAQLERKRANDREAQRAIRQRTKDHIETLERQVRDLTAQIGTNSSTMSWSRRTLCSERDSLTRDKRWVCWRGQVRQSFRFRGTLPLFVCVHCFLTFDWYLSVGNRAIAFFQSLNRSFRIPNGVGLVV
jgi:hypothetical protein